MSDIDTLLATFKQLGIEYMIYPYDSAMRPNHTRVVIKHPLGRDWKYVQPMADFIFNPDGKIVERGVWK